MYNLQFVSIVLTTECVCVLTHSRHCTCAADIRHMSSVVIAIRTDGYAEI